MSEDMAFSNEEIGELIEFLRKEGLDPCDDAADLIEAQSAELSALRERVRALEKGITVAAENLEKINSTRAESPDSVDKEWGYREGVPGNDWGAFVITLNGEAMAETLREEKAKAICQAISPPPPVAGGELIEKLTKLASFEVFGLDYNAEYRQAILDAVAALQHQDGVVISEEDLAELIEAAEATLENFTQEIQPIQSPIHEMVRKLTGVISRAKQSLERNNG